MFDIGFLELLLIAVLSLFIMGPERLPGAVRTITLFFSRMRRSFDQIKSDIEREVGIDEIKQQVHNEAIMNNLAKTKNQQQDNCQNQTDKLKPAADKLQYDIEDIINSAADKKPSDSSHQS